MQIIIDLYDYTGRYIGTLVGIAPDPLFKLFLFMIAIASLPIVIPIIALLVGMVALLQGRISEAVVLLCVPALAVGWLVFYNTWGHNFFVTSDSIQKNYNEVSSRISQGEQLISFNITEGQCNLPSGCKWKNNGLPYLIIEAKSNWKFNSVVRSVKFPNGEAILYCEYDTRQTFDPFGTLIINCSPYELDASIETISYEEICLEMEFLLTPPNWFRLDNDRVLKTFCSSANEPSAIVTAIPTTSKSELFAQALKKDQAIMTVSWGPCIEHLTYCYGQDEDPRFLILTISNTSDYQVIFSTPAFPDWEQTLVSTIYCKPGDRELRSGESTQFICGPPSSIFYHGDNNFPMQVCITAFTYLEGYEKAETKLCRQLPPTN